MARFDLTDFEWSVIQPLLPTKVRGVKRVDDRRVLNGIFWRLRTGAPWADLPDRFPPYQTCHRRFQIWVKDGTLRKLLTALAEDLQTRGKFDLSECFIDGTFVSAKKGGSELERPSGARVRSSWQWQTALVFLGIGAVCILPGAGLLFGAWAILHKRKR